MAKHTVRQGECISSIAQEHGFFWETLWGHPENHSLREERRDPYVLYPGDRVFIPPLREKQEEGGTEARHRFRRRGVPEKLRMVLLEANGEPRANWKYRLVIDGAKVAEGVLGSSGELECSIPPNAQTGTLYLSFGGDNEEIELDLGAIDPIDTVSGVQARLNNLGFECAEADGQIGPKTTEAIEAFQESEELAITGELDDETRSRLREVHGF